SQGEDYYILYQGKTISIAVETDKSLYEEVRYWSDDESIVSFVKGGDKEPYHQSDWQGVSLGSTKIYAEAVKSKVRAEITVNVIEAPIPPRTEFLGSGTEDDPYQINEKYDLLLLVAKTAKYEDKPHYLNEEQDIFTRKHFILTDDILLEADEWNKNIDEFDGVFNGNGQTIKINGAIRYGFIKNIKENGIVKNLRINANIYRIVPTTNVYGADAFLGILADDNLGVIKNCQTSGDIRLDITERANNSSYIGYFVGGIIGLNYAGEMTDCLSSANIIVNRYVEKPEDNTYISIGGIAGYSAGYGVDISKSIFNGSIKYNAKLHASDDIGIMIGMTGPRQYVDLYYDANMYDNRTEEEKNIYDIPIEIIGNGGQYAEIEHINVGGVSDWSTVDFSSWDHEIWDFSGETPELRLFKK
ncbi:MAG: hypothetical protein LBP62_04045, partial [Clostridiales bacterium]|nr:hypothetical protein [Clostridiales bacterium]